MKKNGCIYEKNRGGAGIYEEIFKRCQRQRDMLAWQQERLRKQRQRIAEKGLAGLPIEAVSQSVVDDVFSSLIETLDND